MTIFKLGPTAAAASDSVFVFRSILDSLDGSQLKRGVPFFTHAENLAARADHKEQKSQGKTCSIYVIVFVFNKRRWTGTD